MTRALTLNVLCLAFLLCGLSGQTRMSAPPGSSQATREPAGRPANQLSVRDREAVARARARQIVVHPERPQWLVYSDGRPFFMCGPGDPEGFLYRGTRNPDGTRDGDQMPLIERMAGTGANCIYLMAVRSHGGDGGRTENPFVDSDPARGVDARVLDQWETWFGAMQREGIVAYLFLYDDSARVWNTGDEVGDDERRFIHTIVNRFEHHPLLIWCVAEEYSEAHSAERVRRIATEIREADDYDHVIAVHKLSGLDFSEFADDPNIDQFAIQHNAETAAELHEGMLRAWDRAAGRYNLNMSECASHGTGAAARRRSWACALGGAHVMVLEMDIAGTPREDLEDCGRLVRFMESTTFPEMEPHDELARDATDYVLARPGRSYILYADGPGPLGVADLPAGRYELFWFDPVDGSEERRQDVPLEGGDQAFSRPAGFGDEAALYLRRTDGEG